MDIKQECVNTLRLLSMEQIEKANSGHPGVALDAAPIFFTLYNSIMNYNAKNPQFFNRDRFVISAGHASSLAYSALHMFGYNVTKDDLKKFRRLDSITPGHPEYGVTPGVETSTGPLGQGVANAVGMAIASKHLAFTFNKPDYKLIDNQIYCFVGDGCLMEGIANESLSLAGNLKLDNLTVIYDHNKITIEGSTDLTFKEDHEKKFKALGFNVLKVADGNNLNDLEANLLIAKKEDKKPTLIIVDTNIGFGSHLEGSEKVHGKPLNKEEIKLLQQNLGYTKKAFEITDSVKAYVKEKEKLNEIIEKRWNKMLEYYKVEYPGLYEQFNKYLNFDNKDMIVEELAKLEIDDNISLRDMGFEVMQELKITMPNLIGGTADVAPSTKAYMEDFGSIAHNNYSGRNIHFGIREHAMAGIVNGISLYGGLRTFASTYLAFTDYMKGAMRLSALMNLPVMYITTHDSVLIGQDGPTHQPIEQLISLRAMPNMDVWRPCNKQEVIASYITAIKSQNPTTIVLAKQKIKALNSQLKNALKGGYILSEEEGKLDLILISTGSEIEISLKAKMELEKLGLGTRVVSMPCIEVFERQDKRYKNKVLPNKVDKRIAIEASSSYSFYKYVGENGKIIGMDQFGASGKPQELAKKFGFTDENIVKVAKEIFDKKHFKK